MKKAFTAFIAALLLLLMPLSILAAPYGADAVEEGGTYTLPEMLTLALEDEYLAFARYENVIQKFGAIRPFTNIIRSEEIHIASLLPLLKQYRVPLPENDAQEHIPQMPALSDAFKAGIEGEIANISMYDTFLKQNLPADARVVFTGLRNASERHLSAFQKGLSRLALLPSYSPTVPAG